jgi:hypothetical protein
VGLPPKGVRRNGDLKRVVFRIENLEKLIYSKPLPRHKKKEILIFPSGQREIHISRKRKKLEFKSPDFVVN